MRYNLHTVLSAATIVAALGLSGCSSHDEPKSTPALGTSSAAFGATPPASSSALPAPDTLSDVLCRLADPAVKGTDKLFLVEDTGPDDTTTIDRFTIALRDNGFTQLTCTATDIDWSSRDPGNVVATINITTSDPAKPAGFTFPMEFHPYQDGWQLSRQTADRVLAFGTAGNDTSGSSPSPAPEAPGITPPAAPPPPELAPTPAPPR